MDAILDGLNEQQKTAVTAVDVPLRLIAGAGSGKTSVLMSRIEYLISEIGIMPWKICAITFTNKAAAEMKNRLEKKLGEQAKSVRISTIHALALRILREDCKAAGYPKGIKVLDSEDQKALVRQAARSEDITLGQGVLSGLLSGISELKMSGVSAEDIDRLGMKSQPVPAVYLQYEKKKKELGMVDFDDLLIKARDLLKTDDEVRRKWNRRIEYLHVDEFQDVDQTQYEMIRLLCGPDTIPCVVGDPDQTIYTWRGADIRIILNFEKDFPRARTLFLTQNYRSTKPVLDAANELIANNKMREEKDLLAVKEGDIPVEFEEAADADHEGAKAARILYELYRKGIPFSRMAVLYRNNYLSRSFEKALRLAGIPYRIFGGIRYYERKEVKDLLSYLQLICTAKEDRSTDLAVERVINVPRRGIGSATLDKLRMQAAEENISLLQAMENPKYLTPPYVRKVQSFLSTLSELKEETKAASWDSLVSVVASISGMMSELDQNQEKERIENMLELQQDLDHARKENPDITVPEYLDNIALFSDRIDQDRVESVSLMTIHAAKGTEFDAVIVGGVNEGILPSSRSTDSMEGIEEERRLLYVAMTRAREHLTLSWNRGTDFGTGRLRMPSRFLKEISALQKKQEANSTVVIPAHAPSALRSRPVKLRAGMRVDHSVFGEGFVRSISKGIAVIEFAPGIGVKKIRADHESLKKIS